jgi:3-oxoacyl-[acyl-carrier protein] reductase
MSGAARRCALVTGASRGIGRAVAVARAQAGHDLLLHCHRNREAAEETAARAAAAGARAWLVTADLAADGAPAALVRDVLKQAGRLDVLINNAAALWYGPADEIPDADLRAAFAVNTLGPYRLMTEAAKAMGEGGRIINISSDAAKLPRARVAAYAASKAALESLTLSFAEWLGPRGITVNAVAPGPVRTEMMEPWLRDPLVEASVSRASARRRVADPGDVVPIVLFLASPASGWVNGETIGATGGRVAAW